MDGHRESDEIAIDLLHAAAELQRFAAFVLGLELDYVTPDIQGLTGWVAAARPPCKQPVVLHFRAPHNPVSAFSQARLPEPVGGPPPGNGTSLAQYLDEIPATITLEDEVQLGGPMPVTGQPGGWGPTLWARQQPNVPRQHPDHPNLAVLLDPARDAETLLCGGLLATNAAAATAAPPTSPPASSMVPLPSELLSYGTVGMTWHPGCSLADCHRCPAVAARCGLTVAHGGGGGGVGGTPGDQHLRFLLLQLVAAVCHVHALGYGMGSISPATVMLQPGGWVQLLPPRSWLEPGPGPGLQPPLPKPAVTLVQPVPEDSRSGSRHRPSALPGGPEWPKEEEAEEEEEPAPGVGASGAGGGGDDDSSHAQGAVSVAGPAGSAAGRGTGAQARTLKPKARRSAAQLAALLLPRLPTSLHPPPPTLPALTRAWQHHELSNLDYLLLLNLLAGRRLGDRTFHPFVPWVTDFTVSPRSMLEAGAGGRGGGVAGTVGAGAGSGHGSGGGGSSGGSGWHDLTRSRYRQAKGDMQLDVTYATSDVPHHIPQEPLSELSYCIYMARVTPRAVLQRAVRSHFEPREYPMSMEAMLARSPDECLPQLYTDPDIFRSIHPELPDLELPNWADSPEDFIRWHRALLESEPVSQKLHHWVDLMFGFKLVGQAAIAAKNVYLPAQPQPQLSARVAAGAVGGGSGGAAAAAAAFLPPAEARAPAPAASYAPLGMHAPLFLTRHPPRLPRRAAQAQTRSAAIARHVGMYGGAAAVAAETEAEARAGSVAAAVVAAVAEGYAAGAATAGVAAAVVPPLDSLELLAAVASRDGGLDMHLPFEPPCDDLRLASAAPRVSYEPWLAPAPSAPWRQHQQAGHHHQTSQRASGWLGRPRGPDAAGGCLGGRTDRPQEVQSLDGGWRGQPRHQYGSSRPRGWFAGPSASGGPGLAPGGSLRSVGPSDSHGAAARVPSIREPGSWEPGGWEPWGRGREDVKSAYWRKDEDEGEKEGHDFGAWQVTEQAAAGGWAACGAEGRVGGWRFQREGKEEAAAAAGRGGGTGGAGWDEAQQGGVRRTARHVAAACRELDDVNSARCGGCDPWGLMRRDCQAIGQIAVQVYLGRACFGPRQRTAYWLQLANRLPGAARQFVRLCLDPQVTAERLLSDPFFGPELHAAHALLRTTLYDNTPPRPPPTTLSVADETGLDAAATVPTPQPATAATRVPPLPPPLLLPHQLSALAAAVLHGKLDEIADQRPALELCLPHIMHALWQASAACYAPAAYAAGSSSVGVDGCSGAAGGSAAADASSTPTRMAAHVFDILQALLRLLPPDKVTAHVLPYVCSCLSYFVEDPCDDALAASAGTARCGRSLALQHRLFSPALQVQLLQSSDLDLYVQKALPLLLAALLCVDEGPMPDAVGTAAVEAAAPAAAATAGGGGGGRNPVGSGGIGGVARALAVASISDTATSAVLALASRLPLPLVLERLLGPMLSLLTVSVAVPRLVVQLCVELGGQLTARHVAPALLHMAVVQAPPPPSSQGSKGASARATMRQQSARGSKGGGTAAVASYQRSASAGLRGRGSECPAAAAAVAPAPHADVWLQHQVYTALSLLTALLDLLPREFVPRVFLHGLPPSASLLPPTLSPATSPSTPTPTPHTATATAAAADTLPVFGSPRSPGGHGGGAAGATAGVPPLLSCLLDPSAFHIAPGSLTMLASLSLRAFVRLARPENLAWVVLPHLMPLLAHAAPRRRAAYRTNGTLNRADVNASHDQGPPAAAAAAGHMSYGGGDTGAFHRSRSSPCGADGATAGGSGGGLLGFNSDVEQRDEEDGYWELVHCVYGQLVESSGLLTVRNLLPGWQAVETGLAARLGWSPTAAEAWDVDFEGRHSAGSAGSAGSGAAGTADMATAAVAAVATGGGGASRRSQSSLELQVRQEIASKQQRVAALHGTHLFIKEVGWSAPSALPAAGRSAPRDVPYTSSAAGTATSGGRATGAAAAASGFAATNSQHHRSGVVGGLAALGTGGGVGSSGLHAGALFGAISGLNGGGIGGGAAAESFVWPQLLAIGSPTVAEGLAVRGGGGGGGGNGGLQRQTSGGSSHGVNAAGARRTGGGGVRPAADDSTAGGQAGAAAALPAAATGTLRAVAAVVFPEPAITGSVAPVAPPSARRRQEPESDSSPFPDGSCVPRGPGLGPRGPGGLVKEHGQGAKGATTSPAAAVAEAVGPGEVEVALRPPPGGPATAFVDLASAAAAADADDVNTGAAAGAAEKDSALAAATTAPAAAVPVVGARALAAARQRPSPVHPAIRLVPARSDPGPMAAPEGSATAAREPPTPMSKVRGPTGGGGGGDEGDLCAGLEHPALTLASVSSSAALPCSPFPTGAAPAPSPGPPLQPQLPQPSPPPRKQAQAAATPAGQGPASPVVRLQASRSFSNGPTLAPLLIPPSVLTEGQAPDPGGHRWSWLPPVAVDVPNPAATTLLSPPPTPGHGTGIYGSSTGTGVRAARGRFLAVASAPPTSEVWSLQASVVHSWPAHRDRIRALAVHPGECAVLTAGRGAVAGREGPVVRVWSLSDCQARVQYGGHRAAVQSLLLLRAARAGGAVVASLDAAGQLHLWSYDTGQQLARFAAVMGTTAGGASSGGVGGGGAGGGGGGSGSGAATESDAEPSGGNWGDVIDRSGRYLQNQPPGAMGWQSMGGLKTSRQLSAATTAAAPPPASAVVFAGVTGGRGTLAAGSGGAGAGAPAGQISGGGAAAAAAIAPSPTAGPVSPAAGGGGMRLGYTVMCTAPDEHRMLYAGTADARLCALDLERQRVVSEWVTAPAVRQDAEDAVSALCIPGGGAAAAAAGDGWAWPHSSSASSSFLSPWLAPEVAAVGSRSGRVVVLDRRCGTAAMAFRAHGGEVSAMAPYSSHALISAGADKLLRLWDLRRCDASGSSNGGGGAGFGIGGTSAGYDSRTGPWAGWEGPRGGAGCGGEPLWGMADAMSPLAVGAATYGAEGLYGSAWAVPGGGGGALEFVLSAAAPTACAAGQPAHHQGLQGGVAAPALLRSFPLPREGVQTLRVLRDCLLMTSGCSIGVMALVGEVGGAASPSSAAVAGSGGVVGGPSFARLRNGRGGRESAAITGLAVLPCCRLLVVTGDDGAVRICR